MAGVVPEGLAQDLPGPIQLPLTEGNPGRVVQAPALVAVPEDLGALVGGDLFRAETDRLPALAAGHVVVAVPLPGMLEILGLETEASCKLVQLLVWAIVE